jgi:pilus assembly protein CpaE
LLTSIVISPEADQAGQLSADLSKHGHVRVLRSYPSYPSEEELGRFLQIAGPAILFLGTEDTRRALGLALATDRAGAGTQVVVLGTACDLQFLVASMQAGIREFLSLPLDPDKVTEAVSRIAGILERKPLAFKSTDAVFSFLPAKPGDGASTVAVNVSSAIARESPGKTLLADFDLNVGVISFLLKITNGRSVLDALSVADRMDDVLWDNIVLKRDPMDVLCSGRLEPSSELDLTQAEQIVHFARRIYSTICLDLSGNMDQLSVSLMSQCREIFLVCTSDIASLHFARAKVQFLRDAGLADRASVVINRTDLRTPFSIEELEKVLGLRVRLSLQNDPKRVGDAMGNGTEVNPKSALGRQFETFAKGLLDVNKPGTAPTIRKRSFIEHFAIHPAFHPASKEKRR